MESRTPRETLIYWINEREYIRRHKEEYKASKPWSQDKVMQETYFCNIHREDDRVTRWIRERWSHGTRDRYNVEANMCFARLVNRTESLKNLLWPWTQWNPNVFRYVALEHKERGIPFWGNAYVVTTHGQPMSKVEYASSVLERCFDMPPIVGLPPTLEAYHKALQGLEGFGSFMAGQVVADLKNTPGHPLRDAEDWWTWSAHGPGSLRGLSWYFNEKITPSTYQAAIKEAKMEVREHVPNMCYQDFQNCLCEYDKYMRVSTGTGRSKRKYNGNS